ncbi:MAG: GGDEF domain-containing protein [Gammaproteobacteria bacterium]|nr:GGDEF domain-containing protein [Gammaproteobacteria bacterium]
MRTKPTPISQRVSKISGTDNLSAIDDVATPLETVDLAQIDLDFAGDEQRHTDATTVRAAGGVVTTTASAPDLARVDLFRGVGGADLALFAAQTCMIDAAPGSVLQAAGQLSDRIFFVIAGELRMYADRKEKRPRGIVDAGQSVGLSWALLRQPTEIAIIATEAARVLVLRLPQLDEFARRSHAFACNVNALFAAYLRGDNCLNVGARALAALHQRRGYTDELTQLHNENWLMTMLPRLLRRNNFDRAPLTLAMLAIDKFDEINREFGSIAGDQMLAAVGQLLLDRARTTDLLVCDNNRRFLAILPNTTADGGRIFCQHLLDAARLLRIGAPDDQPLPALTLACGIVQYSHESSAPDLFAKLNTLTQQSMKNGGSVSS